MDHASAEDPVAMDFHFSFRRIFTPKHIPTTPHMVVGATILAGKHVGNLVAAMGTACLFAIKLVKSDGRLVVAVGVMVAVVTLTAVVAVMVVVAVVVVRGAMAVMVVVAMVIIDTLVVGLVEEHVGKGEVVGGEGSEVGGKEELEGVGEVVLQTWGRGQGGQDCGGGWSGGGGRWVVAVVC